MIFGWVYIIAVTVPLLTGWFGGGILENSIFGLVVAVDAISFSVFIFLKFHKQRMEAISINP